MNTRVLLALDQKDLRELLSFHLTSNFPVEVKECSSGAEAAELLGQAAGASLELLIYSWEGVDSPMFQAVNRLANPVPSILVLDGKAAKPGKGELKGVAVLGEVAPAHLAEGVGQFVKDFLADPSHRGMPGISEQAEEFCPIRTNLLVRATPLRSDIYIRLGKTKFVKLFKSGDEFDTRDLERYYQEKKVEYLFLKRSEMSEFIGKFRKELDDLLARNDIQQEEALQKAEVSQEAIHELVNHIGFNEEVQELARKNVEFTLKAIGANPRLSDLIQNVVHLGSYLSQHSTLLAHVSCCVAKEMEWGSESTFSKLVLAAYMHDISVTDPDLARLNTLKELEEKKAEFQADVAKSYHLHPAKSADVVRAFKEIPSDVDVIVQQHHERPNGGGFPRGLTHNYIAPLGALFIVAHDLTQAILDQREQFNLGFFVDEKRPLFNQGNFKKVMIALEKVKL